MARPPRKPPRAGALNALSPLRIATQILALQAIYYATGSFLICFTAVVAGARVDAGLILDWRRVRGDTTLGWLVGFVWLVNAVFGAISLLLLIARSKLIPDFALTIHLLHLLLTSLYTRAIPSHALWWALQAASAALMTALGVWSCRWREMRPISFGGGAAAAAATAPDGAVRGEYELVQREEGPGG
ncbi:MAG: hypothetical protein M1824_000163 [Vezdaea acicularis]|nr:MAG: hypothetical protein M1824_000163 [Vezdaea acicularis]